MLLFCYIFQDHWQLIDMILSASKSNRRCDLYNRMQWSAKLSLERQVTLTTIIMYPEGRSIDLNVFLYGNRRLF